jgi:hypothetical protein
MKLYRVTVPGRSWTMTAPNIQAASQFVKHCPSVRLRTICGYTLDIEAQTDEQRAARMSPKITLNMWTPTHVAIVATPPDPNCRWCGESEHARGGACVALDHG